MTISLAMILILIAILLFGIGFWQFSPAGPRTKGWVIFGLFVVAAVVVLYFAGALRVA